MTFLIEEDVYKRQVLNAIEYLYKNTTTEVQVSNKLTVYNKAINQMLRCNVTRALTQPSYVYSANG